MKMFYKLQQKVENWFGHVFEKYGRFVARNPFKIILLVVFINIGLGFGLLRLEQESGIEQYTPTDSTASKNRDQIRELFAIDTAVNYYQQSLPDLGLFASVIIERNDEGNILDSSLWGDISALYDFINTTTAHDSTMGLALMGGNCVANRYNLGFAGILGTGLAIVGSFGLVSLCGAKFVDIVGAMPFLILGIGVDDMFILLSGLADTSSKDSVEDRIGQTMRTSGISVTITSVTDVIAFCAGAASVFPSVRNFSWYTGCAILFCYLNYVTYYIGCMTINEKRVSKNIHFCTCMPTKTRTDMEAAGQSKCKIFCCAGSPHKTRDEIEGPIEKYPKRLVKRIVLFKPTQIIICILFAVYLGFSVWGTTGFQEGLDIRDLVGKDSYYYDFYDTDQNMFSQSLIVSLNIQSDVNYRFESSFNQINSLVTNVQKDSQVFDDFLLSWLHAYRSSAVFDNTSDALFISGLQSFLSTVQGNVFVNDVMFDTSNSIVASRIHIMTESITSSNSQADLMVKIRESVESSSLPVFAYSPGFIFFEQYVQILPQTLQTLGICVAVVFVVTAIFMPLPFMIILVTVTVVMIMVGVIGFIKFWDLTLSSVTMIHIIMCVGFCIDFSTHMCHAFVQAEGTRNVRVAQALDMAGGPIFNGAISTIIGVLMLVFSSSYVFFSFFKIMLLVMVFGLIHSVFLLPVILAYIGPQYKVAKSDVYPEKTITFGGKQNRLEQTLPEPHPDYPGAE
ncbi:unnamed protein product [Mytilus coruscus]|uniref:SSD domain-containing protein n=1 Tax=Mytilus coruscus TaxID=42192 RepID=A0A6J8E613_MYTCO|nr:unnamed protein product [Mytilus coruscus]